METEKKCNRCGLILPVDEFYKRKDGKVRNPCKNCKKIINAISNKKWSQTDEGKSKQKLYNKKYKIKKKEENRIIREEKRQIKINEQLEKKRIKDLVKQEKLQLKIQLKNKKKEEYIKKLEYYKSDEYKELKRKRTNAKNYIRWKKKWETNTTFAMKVRLRNLIRKSFIKRGYSKSSKTQDILGIDYEGLVKHIESQFKDGMTWENRGEWHIDHIIPLSSATSEDELTKLCHYTNLQPLWEKDNLEKSNKIL
jgi:hypothetical protein